MSEMIERVAKAVLDAMDLTDGLDGTAAETYARAAIEAMREPTKPMYRTAADQCSTTDLASSRDFERHYVDVWETMIDAALGKVDT